MSIPEGWIPFKDLPLDKGSKEGMHVGDVEFMSQLKFLWYKEWHLIKACF